jgi:hypothetical protein
MRRGAQAARVPCRPVPRPREVLNVSPPRADGSAESDFDVLAMAARRAAAPPRTGTTIMDDEEDGLLSRRRLLETGALGAAGLALLGADAFAAPRRFATAAAQSANAVPPVREGYRRSRFEPHVGTTAQLRAPGSPAVLVQLAAVEDVAQVEGLAGAQDAYVLRFRGPAAQPLGEGMVTVRHRRFGTLRLHVAPAVAGATTQDYLAAINRRIPRDATRGARHRR